MPIDVTFSDDNGGVLFVGYGTLTAGEFLEARKELYRAAEQAPQIRYQIVDLMGVDGVVASNADIAAIAELDLHAAPAHPHMIIAVAAAWDLPFGLARMWETLVQDSGLTTRVCRSREEAEDWVKAELPPT